MIPSFSPTFKTNAAAIAFGLDQQVIVNSEPVSLDFYTKATHISDKAFHQKRVETLAVYYSNKLEQYLKEHPRRPIPEALNDPFLDEEVRDFMRDDASAYSKNPSVHQCKRLFLAAKLGIDLAVFDANEGFEAFASKHIERYLLLYNEPIVVDESNEVFLKYRGEMTRWSEIYAHRRPHLGELLGFDPSVFDIEANEGFEAYALKYLERYLQLYGKPVVLDEETQEVSLIFNGVLTKWSEIKKPVRDPVLEGEMHWHWPYDLDGVQWTKDFFVFDILKPMFIRKKRDDEPNIDIFRIRACWTNKTWLGAITGVHVWMNVETADGKIYAPGIYRPEKNGYFDHIDDSLRVKPAFYCQDVSEFWRMEEGQECSIEVAVTPEQRDQILERFARESKDPNTSFQISQRNCVTTAAGYLHDIVGVTLPTEQSVFGLLNPRRFHWITNRIPRKIREICVAVGNIFLNLVQVALGAHKVDKKVAKGAKPILCSFWDLFNPEKANGHHPYTIMTKTRDWVENWRAKEKARLEGLANANTAEIQEQIKMLRYRLPPESELASFY